MPQNIRQQKLSLPFTQQVTESTEVKVASISEARCSLSSYNRRDFFKVTLLLHGTSELNYSNRSYAITKPALVFTQPHLYLIRGTWWKAPLEPSGFFCVFTESFLQSGIRMESLKDSVLYKAGGNPVYFLDDDQMHYLTHVFTRMRQDVASDYIHKYDLLRNQLSLIIHEAIKMQPAGARSEPANAATQDRQIILGPARSPVPVASHVYMNPL